MVLTNESEYTSISKFRPRPFEAEWQTQNGLSRMRNATDRPLNTVQPLRQIGWHSTLSHLFPGAIAY
ncbi:hypothetical protein RRG08_036732 [Elysia crispata]|uniref:Uncharacterized protein n=1 Tax=Elysia crispata TaxID=231223 RepID=A0AAE1CMV5_9GAST|nr:hypothetical protein RRG08_036732 [Elysia crispata]